MRKREKKNYSVWLNKKKATREHTLRPIFFDVLVSECGERYLLHHMFMPPSTWMTWPVT